ncbi:sulfite reductase subunit beta [Lentinula raphanica]|nr:sulfite reductase subunit beta [Lentinula raphanica]
MPIRAVLRIAQLASQNLIDLYSSTHAGFEDVAGNLLSACQAGSGLVSLITSDSADRITRALLPHAGDLSHNPLVIHIGVEQSLSSIFLLDAIFPVILLSVNPQEAHDNSLIASYLARSLGIAVIHAYCRESSIDMDIMLEEQSVVDYLSEVTGSVDISSTEQTLWEAYKNATIRLSRFTSRSLQPFSSHYSQQGSEIHTVIFLLGHHLVSEITIAGVLLVYPKIIAPLPTSYILESVPPHASRVFVLEQLQEWPTKWTTFYMEVVRALQKRHCMIRRGVLDYDKTRLTDSDLARLLSPESDDQVQLGSPLPSNLPASMSIPKHESSYLEVLKRLFDVRFEHSNSPNLVPTHGHLATNPEFALGRVRGQVEERARLVKIVESLLHESSTDNDLHTLLSKWHLHRDDVSLGRALGQDIISELGHGDAQAPMVQQILSLKDHLSLPSRWIIISSWSYDLGSSGLHHILSSGLNVNVLIIHTTPYSARQSNNHRQHDIGLYAMNYGSVYVASVALYSSYAHMMQALVEADRFDGPSVVLGYLPYLSEQTSAIDILKETKLAVDAGYWPLYRWDPSKKDERETFSLDSDHIKNDLAQFLDRQNHLSQLVRSRPALAADVAGSLGQNLKDARLSKARDEYNKLLHAVDAPPMRIFYASDGGGAEKMAKRLAARGKIRGLDVNVAVLDTISLDTLAHEEGYAVFITSTAGQGEPPQNGKKFFKSLNAAMNQGDNKAILLSGLRYLVFGLGDSHYWPRPEDAHYYNRPSRELDSKLSLLGAQRLLELHLGDSQDADGPETQYKVWEARIWKLFGVDSIEVSRKEPQPITLEHVKAASGYLRGTIAEGIADLTTGALAPTDPPLTKYHGIWQQDDRDIREERQAQGLEPAYNFMVRVRMPGGLCTPMQWLQLDRLADEYGNGTMKITTRQTLQFHGILKKYLKKSIQDINKALLDTLEVGGDVNSNIVCSSIPTMSDIYAQVHSFCTKISDRLMPRTTAYHEIWLDQKMVAGHAVKDFEPVYSEWYLPRKFKIAIAVPPTNDVDIFTNDLGYIAIIDDDGTNVIGYNVLVGGGMGITLGNQKTYPRIASLIGFCTPEQAVDVAEKVTLVQRDFGDRVDRKTARLKYTVDRMGLEIFKTELEMRLGYTMQESRPFSFDRNLDEYGWVEGQSGRFYFTTFIENGRIQDTQKMQLKACLREIAKIHKGSFRLTTNQHLIIAEVEKDDIPKIKDILSRYNINNGLSGLRLSSSACVAFPTCGLAMAESERYLPLLIDKLEIICEESGLRNDSIMIRMTGCPAGCTRPNVAEIGFLGKAPGAYVMLLGGGENGQRLARVYRENVTEPEILAILAPMIKHYALDRYEHERFGDFVIRKGYIEAVNTSHEFWK